MRWVLSFSILLTGIVASAAFADATLDEELRLEIQRHGLTGDPSTGRLLPAISDPISQLGRDLFFSKALGGDKDVACASCHHPVLGGGDDLPLSIGVEATNADLLGPGRRHDETGTNYDGGPTVPRNAPTTFNIALWDRVLFHDGRIQSLSPEVLQNGAGGPIRTPDVPPGNSDAAAGQNLPTAQARFPVTSPEEMRGFSYAVAESNANLRQRLESRLRGTATPPELEINNWLTRFQDAFDQPGGSAETLITFENIVFAISEYERSQVFVNTPWKSYVLGDDDALSESAKRGALDFLAPRVRDGAGCAACHSGDFFTNEGFANIAMPQVGRGKGDDNGLSTTADFGRFRESADLRDRHAFRVPSLLNVEVTGPYGHDGTYANLSGVVKHHLNPIRGALRYDPAQLLSGVQISDLRANTSFALRDMIRTRTLRPQPSTKQRVSDLVAFLRTLTDPCVKDRGCLAPWIPDPKSPDPDGLRLNAVDASGQPI